MTGKLSGQIMETGFLKGAKARVLIALASVSDGYGQSWHSYVSIAHHARCSRKTAIQAIKWMELYELVHIQRGRYLPTKSGKTTSATNLYTLHLEFFEALHQMAGIIRKITPGDAKMKWQAVTAAALWAEDQVYMCEWRQVIEIVNAHPHVIRQTCLGVDPEMRSQAHGAGGSHGIER